MKKSVDWVRLIVQGLAVTASILLALAVDAMWDYRQDRVEETAALERLRTEFEANRSTLVAARERHELRLENAIRLLRDLERTRSDPTYVFDDALLASLWNWTTYDPSSGVLNSLIASGQLGLIENDSLKAALTGWPDQVADLNEDEISQRETVRQHVLPFLARNTSFRRLLRARADELGLVPDRAEAVPLDDALLGQELENWLIDRIETETTLLRSDREIAGLLTSVDQILRLMNQELEGGAF